MNTFLEQGATILVTGGTGFIGRAVVAALQGAGYRARVSSRRVLDWPGVEVVPVGPLSGTTDWGAALDGVAGVMHLAAHVHVQGEAADDDAAFVAANAEGSARLAEQAAAAGIARLVFFSSVSVWGEGRDTAYSEADATNPGTAYGRSKLQAERLLAQQGGMVIPMLRPPLVYGAGVGANFLSLLKLVDKGWPLPFGATGNKRSLVSVKNLASAALHLLTSEAAETGPYLVSDGEDVSTTELVRKMQVALGRSGLLLPVPGGPMLTLAKAAGVGRKASQVLGSFTVDPGKLKASGWQRVQNMDEGLAETALAFRAR